MRIIFVTDSHLAPALGAFTDNWNAARNFVGHLVAHRLADLTIHLGDITMHGIDEPQQLHFARDLTRDWPTPLYFVPGNHDIGDNPPGPTNAAAHPLDEVRLQQYRQLFGPDYWLREIGDWQLLGLNAQLFGSDTQSEIEQWRWLEAALKARASRPTIVCLHKPLFRENPSDPQPHIRYVPLGPRQRLLAAVSALNVQLIISGHTHQYLNRRLQGLRHIWLPSTAFYIPDHYQERIGEKIIGLGALTLAAHTCEFDLVSPPTMMRHNISDFVTYPPVHKPEA